MSLAQLFVSPGRGQERVRHCRLAEAKVWISESTWIGAMFEKQHVRRKLKTLCDRLFNYTGCKSSKSNFVGVFPSRPNVVPSLSIPL